MTSKDEFTTDDKSNTKKDQDINLMFNLPLSAVFNGIFYLSVASIKNDHSFLDKIVASKVEAIKNDNDKEIPNANKEKEK